MDSSQSTAPKKGTLYEIKIKGLLNDHWQDWFEGMTLQIQENTEAGEAFTLITGPITDQPALHGLLEKIRDLNLPLLSVRILPSAAPSQAEEEQKPRPDN